MTLRLLQRDPCRVRPVAGTVATSGPFRVVRRQIDLRERLGRGWVETGVKEVNRAYTPGEWQTRGPMDSMRNPTHQSARLRIQSAISKND